MFRFASPWFLLVLLVPWTFLAAQTLGLTRKRGGQRAGLHVAVLDRAAHLPLSPALAGARLLPWVKVLALSLMILALARPQAGDQKITVTSQGVNIILALDLSESMSALDFKREGEVVTRLEAVKGVVADFILERDGDRIGMVVFGSHAFTQLPLTRDYNTIALMLDHLSIGLAGPRTAIGDAIGICLKRLSDQKGAANLIILLTDGKSNAGTLSWQDASTLAAQKGVRIHTIGVGSRGKVPFLVDGFFGKNYVYQEVEMDWQALETIASQTGGRFFKAQDTEGLKEIYSLINALEKTRVEVDKWVEYEEIYPSFLIPGLLLYLGCLFLSNTWLIRIP